MIEFLIPVGLELIMDYLACKQKWVQSQIVERNFGMLVAHTKFATPKLHEHIYYEVHN